MAATLVLAVILAACSGAGTSERELSPTTGAVATTTTTTIPPTTTTVPTAGVPTDFSRAVIELAGDTYNVAVADTPDELSRGLMGVEDLSPLDGMLFVYSSERFVSHWMKDTLIPLDIAFFDAGGNLVNVLSMETCPDDDCPSYASDAPAQYAVEVPFGGFDDLPAGSKLVIIGSLEGTGKEI